VIESSHQVYLSGERKHKSRTARVFHQEIVMDSY